MPTGKDDYSAPAEDYYDRPPPQSQPQYEEQHISGPSSPPDSGRTDAFAARLPAHLPPQPRPPQATRPPIQSGSLKSADDSSDDSDNNNQQEQPAAASGQGKIVKMGHTFGMLPHPRIDKYGMSPLPLNHLDIINLRDERQAWGLVSPPHSAVVYRLSDIRNIFLALLLLQVRLAMQFA